MKFLFSGSKVHILQKALVKAPFGMVNIYQKLIYKEISGDDTGIFKSNF